MLSILINGQMLDLAPDAKIFLRRRTNLFNFEIFEASQTLPFDIPFSDAARRAFQHAQRIDSPYKLGESVVASLYFKGNLYQTGVFTLDRVRPKSFEGRFLTDLSRIAADKDRDIQELLSNVSFDFGETTVGALYNRYKKNDVVCFPKVFCWNEPARKNGDFVLISPSQICPVFNVRGFKPNRQVHNSFHALPFFKVRFVVETILSLYRYRVQFTSDPIFDDLVLFGNRVLTMDTLGNIEPSTQLGLHVPSMSLAMFLKGLKTAYGICVEFNFNDTEAAVFSILIIPPLRH